VTVVAGEHVRWAQGDVMRGHEVLEPLLQILPEDENGKLMIVVKSYEHRHGAWM
jgi:hypothetical protein